jgi:hypothetical protein
LQLAANVTSGNDLDWHAIDWKRSYRIVKNLRQRIFRASRDAPLGVRKLLEPLQVDNFHLALHARVRMMIMLIIQGVDITFTELYFEHLSTFRWDR